MIDKQPHPVPQLPTTPPEQRERQRIEATMVGRLMRDPVSSNAMTQLVVAVNVPSVPLPGCPPRRPHHATFLLVLALEDAHQAFLEGLMRQARSGALIRVMRARLELVPFTRDYESIDHRLEARVSERRHLCVLQGAATPSGLELAN